MKDDQTLAEIIAWMDPFANSRHVPCSEAGEEIEEYRAEQEYLASMLTEESP